MVERKETDVYSLPCSHIYHLGCLQSMIGDKKWIKCPVCSSIYGKMMGDMPEGKISFYVDKHMKCEGYEVPTIVISYDMYNC